MSRSKLADGIAIVTFSTLSMIFVRLVMDLIEWVKT